MEFSWIRQFWLFGRAYAVLHRDFWLTEIERLEAKWRVLHAVCATLVAEAVAIHKEMHRRQVQGVPHHEGQAQTQVQAHGHAHSAPASPMPLTQVQRDTVAAVRECLRVVHAQREQWRKYYEACGAVGAEGGKSGKKNNVKTEEQGRDGGGNDDDEAKGTLKVKESSATGNRYKHPYSDAHTDADADTEVAGPKQSSAVSSSKASAHVHAHTHAQPRTGASSSHAGMGAVTLVASASSPLSRGLDAYREKTDLRPVDRPVFAVVRPHPVQAQDSPVGQEQEKMRDKEERTCGEDERAKGIAACTDTTVQPPRIRKNVQGEDVPFGFDLSAVMALLS